MPDKFVRIMGKLMCLSCRSEKRDFAISSKDIVCGDCGHTYPIINGIPSILPPRSGSLSSFTEIPIEEQDAFIRMKKKAYFGKSFVSKLYNHYHRYTMQRRQEFEATNGVKDILDIGCGIGEHYPFLSPEDRSRYFGLDLDRFKLEYFHANHSDICLVQGNAVHLPFSDFSFGVVQSLAMLEHFNPEDGAMLVREAIRVLCPGGIFIVCYPAEGSFLLNFGRLIIHPILQKKSETDLGSLIKHQHLSDFVEIINIMGKCDLKKIDSLHFPFFVPSLHLSLFINETYMKLAPKEQER